jgi:hypothetical protein
VGLFSDLALPAQLSALCESRTALTEAPAGDLVLEQARVNGHDLFVAGFDSTRHLGSMGHREAAQIVALLRLATERGLPVVFLINSSGVRATEGNHGIAALRIILRAGLDAALDGVRMLALITRNCFGGASVLACLCEQQVVQEASLLSMSGPKLIQRISGEADLVASDKEAVLRLMGGRQRTRVSSRFKLVGDEAGDYRLALTRWLEAAPAPRPMLGSLSSVTTALRERLRAAGRWPATGSLVPWREGAIRRLVEEMTGMQTELMRAGAFVRGKGASNDAVMILGLAGGGHATAIDVQQMLEALDRSVTEVRHLVVLLDSESHAATAADEGVLLSEYLAALALRLRTLHRAGVTVHVVVTGVTGGGIGAALLGPATRASMLAGARMRVLPAAALAALNMSEDESGTIAAHALRTGAIDDVIDFLLEGEARAG